MGKLRWTSASCRADPCGEVKKSNIICLLLACLVYILLSSSSLLKYSCLVLHWFSVFIFNILFYQSPRPHFSKATDNLGNTPLFYACESNSAVVVNRLSAEIAHSDLTVTNKKVCSCNLSISLCYLSYLSI